MEKRIIKGEAWCVSEDNIWGAYSEANGVFKVAITDDISDAEYAFRLPDCVFPNAWRIKKIIHTKGKLFIFSKTAYQLWIHDLSSGETKTVLYRDDAFTMIKDIICIADNIWVFPNDFFKPVSVISTKSETHRVVTWKSNLMREGLPGVSGVFAGNDGIYAVGRSVMNNYIVRINYCDERTHIWGAHEVVGNYCVYVTDEMLYTIGVYKGKLGLAIFNIAPDGDKLYEFIELKGLKVIKNVIQTNYLRMDKCGEWLYLFPADKIPMIRYNIVSGEEEVVDWTDLIDNKAFRDFPYIYDIQRVKDEAYLLPYRSGEIIVVDMKKNTLDRKRLICYSIESIRRLMDNCEVIHESGELFTLRNFIEV